MKFQYIYILFKCVLLKNDIKLGKKKLKQNNMPTNKVPIRPYY